MPTTCGFPNCRFRSRYRGAEDNRHFYRVPKKPAILRKKWLEAIGRTEETIVSQLRVCSGHFYGGEKHEGDVPVADPAVDEPIKVELPPKISRFPSTVNKRNCCGTRGGGGVGRGRGLHHTQGIRNKMCFLKSGMLNYMTKHNNCLNILGSFKPKHTLASNSTQSSPTLRNDHKTRANKPTNIINSNNDSNSPLMWFNNLYSPHIYDYLKTISLNSSTSSLPELNTNKKYLYDPRKHFNSTSINKDQSIVQNYSHQSPQQINYPIDKYTSFIHTSTCHTPLTSTTVCLTNLIQNENNILKKSCNSPFNNNDNINNINSIIHDNKPQSAFTSVTSMFDNNNNNINDINISKDFINNNDYLMKTSYHLNKEQSLLNVSTDNNKNKLTSTISIPFTSNISADYFLSFTSIMNNVLTKKFNDTYYYNSSKLHSNNQYYQQMNIKNELYNQNNLNNEYNSLSNYSLNIINSNNSMNEFNEIKDLSMKSESIKEYENIMKYYIKTNELYSINNYEQNNNESIEDLNKDNDCFIKMNNCNKLEPVNNTVDGNRLQIKEEKLNQVEDIPSLNRIVQYVIFIGIDELTIEMPILHDVINLLCVQYSDLKNLPEHIRQNVSDIVTYQEIILSVEYLQYFSILKNVYIPECLTCINRWDEVKNLGINLHIVPLELDVNKSADFIIGIILSTHYDIMSIYVNEKNQPTVKRPASSPSQSTMNQLVQIDKPLYNHTNDIVFKHTTTTTTTTTDQTIENIVSNNQGAQLNTDRNIQIGIIGLGPISLTIIRQLEKFNYNIRVFDKYLPDGIDTVLGLNYTNNHEEIIHGSDWIIFIQETSILKDLKLFGKSDIYSPLTVNEIFNENIKAKMKSGCHILYINLVDDYPHEVITLNTIAHSGYVADIYALLRKSCEKLTNEFNIQRSSNLICLNNKLHKLQVQSEELRRHMSQFLRRNLLKNLMFIPKMNETNQTDMFKYKAEPQFKMTLNNQKINTLKKNTNMHQKIPLHGIKKHLTFGINSLVAPKTLKYYPTHCG
ncbi:unnamed protein product [Schistosoma spindalis]|nr:unnamed protein product [Schistosoma spindale]